MDGALEPDGSGDDFTTVVNILDDARALDCPESLIGSVLLNKEEAESLDKLSRIMIPLIEVLGEAPDSDYVKSSDWGLVVSAARSCLRVMGVTPHKA